MLYGYGGAGEAYARCICDCGKECIKSVYGIRHSRNPAHCGCMTRYYKRIQSENSRKDLTGMKFGRLTVLEMKYVPNGHTKSICKCDCGNTIEVISTYLTSGDTKSCGCYQKHKASEANTKDFTGTVSDYGVIFISREYKNNKNQWMWKCKCGMCDNEFVALPAKVLNGHITSCGCAKTSSGERLVETILDENGVCYKREYRFKDCKNKKCLPFDFYIPEINTVIEYQGAQHYKPVDIFGGEHEMSIRKNNDNIKKEYCKNNNINLLELPYTLSKDDIKEKIQTLFIRRDCNG